MTTAEARHGIAEGLRTAAPDFWLLAILVATTTNLLDFAVVPAPGAKPGAAFILAALVRVVAVFWVSYALARRMAGASRALSPTVGLARFSLFLMVELVAYAAFGKLIDAGVGLAEQPLATQFLVLLAVNAAFGIATIRLIGLGPGFATGARFGEAGAIVRATWGDALGLALAFVQVVVPLAAVHLALTLVAVRLPLSGPATAALALIDGLVSGAQLLCTSALSVVAWRRAGLPLHGGGRRG